MESLVLPMNGPSLTQKIDCLNNEFNPNQVFREYSAPNGSVCGPLLFLIYINSLYKAIKLCIFLHFADDNSTPHFSYRSINSINMPILTWCLLVKYLQNLTWYTYDKTNNL